MTYEVSAANGSAFPAIQGLANAGTVVANSLRRGKNLRLLPGGELFLDSRIELDTDGWPGGGGRGDRHYQTHTSLRLANGTSLDANSVPYFVLPQPVEWPKQFKIWLGDVAAFLYEGQIAFALFGDFGGTDSIGEGSLELFRRLGMKRLKTDGRIENVGSPPGVISIVFPGSRPALKYRTMAEAIAETEKRGREHWNALIDRGAFPASHRGGALEARVQPGLASEIVRIARSELRRFGGIREEVEPLNSRIAEYWRALGESYTGADNSQYWSAAFVSHVVRSAGAGDAFHYSIRHSSYVYHAIRDREEGRPGRFWGYRPQDMAIAPGDILAMNQTGSRPIAFEEARHEERYPSHSDIVVRASNGIFTTIGGNVGNDTVGEKKFAWSGHRLARAENKAQQVFAVLRAPAI